MRIDRNGNRFLNYRHCHWWTVGTLGDVVEVEAELLEPTQSSRGWTKQVAQLPQGTPP